MAESVNNKKNARDFLRIVFRNWKRFLLGSALMAPAMSAYFMDIAGEAYRARVMGLKESALALGGVLGPLPGVIGAMMAVEAVKEIAQAGEGLRDYPLEGIGWSDEATQLLGVKVDGVLTLSGTMLAQ